MNHNYVRSKDVHTFGAELLATHDLDPIYDILHMAREVGAMSQDQTKRWMVAYWCFYNAGVATHFGQFVGDSFWDRMDSAALPGMICPLGVQWPRGRERRHFRAQNAAKAIAHLRDRYTFPEAMVDGLCDCATFAEAKVLAESHVGFGPWISWKMADMVERVLDAPIDFSGADLSMYKEPTEGALMLYRELNGEPTDPREAVTGVVESLVDWFGSRNWAPPSLNRPVNVQEVETILCKWKAHVNGYYPPLNDTLEISETLHAWSSVCPLAPILRKLLPCL